jgi:hypothetical protein
MIKHFNKEELFFYIWLIALPVGSALLSWRCQVGLDKIAWMPTSVSIVIGVIIGIPILIILAVVSFLFLFWLYWIFGNGGYDPYYNFYA